MEDKGQNQASGLGRIDEVALVQRARSGDIASFSELVQAHAGKGYRIARALLRDSAEAEDSVQEALIAAYRSLGSLKREECFGPWFYRIVVNKSRDRLRRRKPSIRIADLEGSNPAVFMDPADFARSSELSLDLWQAVEQLPERHRLAIWLYYGEGANTEDISRILGRPSGTVRRVLSESYRLLRHILEKGKAP